MSIIDYKRKHRSPYIWEGEHLIPSVRSFITGMLKESFPDYIGAYILGSITTLHWRDSSDVDVNVVYPDKTKIKPLSSVAIGLAKQKIKIPGSPHVIGFYVTHEKDVKDNINKTVGAYDISHKQWVKRPDDLYEDPKKHEKKFQKRVEEIDIEAGELRRDLSDIRYIIETYKHAPEDEKAKILEDLEGKKKEIEEDIKALTEDYDDLHKARLKAFEKEMSTEGRAAVNKHLYNQTLPGNVIFKMMERYGYRDLLESLRDIERSLPG